MSSLYSFLTFFQPGIFWPELSVLRPMLILSVLALLTGLARPSTFPRSEAFGHPAFFWMIFFIVAQVFSLYYGGLGSILDELGFWYVYPAFVAISILLIPDTAALRRYVWGMMLGCLVIVVYGIYAVYAELPAAVGGRAGAYGMYENHNDYSFIIVMALPFMYMYRRLETGFLKRATLAFGILASILGMFLSLSRGGMLALVLEIGLLFMFTRKGAQRVLMLSVVVAFGAVAIAYQWSQREANQGDQYTAEDAQASREELWRASREMVLKNPVLGVGSRRFGEFASDYAEISGDNRGKNSHNTYVEVIATSGLLGFIGFMMFIYRLLKDLIRTPVIAASEWVEATRIACLTAFVSILFRAFLDAKPHDWSFYLLCALGIVCGAIQRQFELNSAPSGGTAGAYGPLQSVDKRVLAKAG
jgi:O-antigen ligase